MADENLIQAIVRLDSVLQRTEAAMSGLLAAPREVSRGDTDLPQRHERLRVATEQAVARLDRLLADEAG